MRVRKKDIIQQLQLLADAQEAPSERSEGDRALLERMQTADPPSVMSDRELEKIPTYGPKNIVD